MATKTITIDMEAYRLLSRAKRENESFSRVIRRIVHPPLDVRAYLKRIDDAPLSKEAVAALERHEDERHRASRRDR